jgi:hypothetical protein
MASTMGNLFPIDPTKPAKFPVFFGQELFEDNANAARQNAMIQCMCVPSVFICLTSPLLSKSITSRTSPAVQLKRALLPFRPQRPKNITSPSKPMKTETHTFTLARNSLRNHLLLFMILPTNVLPLRGSLPTLPSTFVPRPPSKAQKLLHPDTRISIRVFQT